MGKRWIKISLVVTIAFTLTVVCEHVLAKSYAQHDLPFRGIPFLCFLLDAPGYLITGLAPDLVRRSPVVFRCLLIASNTLVYSGLFGLVLMFVTESSRPATSSAKPLLNGVVLRLFVSAAAALILSMIGMGLYFSSACWDDASPLCSPTRRWISFLLAAPIFLMQRLFGRAENATNFDPVVFAKFGWAALWAYYYAGVLVVASVIRRFRNG
jgi:hypothetical protein